MTRLVDELQSRGLVTKRASAVDGRGTVASLTTAGSSLLKRAWRIHVSSVRALVFDHVDPIARKDAARAVAEIAARLEDRL
jgi:DNA-binding MarR family transcriptional regulator